MAGLILLLGSLGLSPAVAADGAGGVWSQEVVPIYMVVQGAAIAGLWTVDIASGKLEGGFFTAKENGVLYWPHVSAEYLTAAALATGGIGYLSGAGWSDAVAYPALGALFYTSLNSLNWALAEKQRLPYAVPMFIGLFGSVASMLLLSTGS
jgi:hypothetical protein